MTSFAEGKLPAGIAQSKGDVGRTGYLGPCPPPGSGAHRYVFTIYALKVDKLDIDPNASGALVGFNLNGNALDKVGNIQVRAVGDGLRARFALVGIDLAARATTAQSPPSPRCLLVTRNRTGRSSGGLWRF
jgi:hypothetical protein